MEKKIENERRKWIESTKSWKERKTEFFSRSGIKIKRLYTPTDAEIDYLRDLGFPGNPPFTRGIYPTMYRGRPWTMRMFSGHGTAEETNERWKMLYREGETGFSAAVDVLTHCGFSPDDQRYDAEVGTEGVPIYSIKSMEALVKDVPIEKVSVAFPVQSFAASAISAMYFNVAMCKGIDLKNLMGTTTNDLLTITLARPQPKMVSPKNLLKLSCDLIEFCTVDNNVPKWHPISVTGYNVRESGLNVIQELAFVFATIKSCCDELIIGRGKKIDEFADRLAVHLSAHNDFLEEIAKFRAARRIWYKLMKDHYEAKDATSLQLRFHVQTAGVSLTAQQPLINIARVAYQSLAAILGGCQSLHTDSYDEAMCLPSEEAVRTALRTQQIILEETNVTDTIDPLGGSYYIEWFTNEIEEQVWDYMDKIDAAGGFIKSLESGWAYNETVKAFYKHQEAIERGEEKIIGVNCHKTEEELEMKAFKTNPMAARIEEKRIKKLKRERDNKNIEELLSKLYKVCDKNENVMPTVMALAKEGATVQEICDVYRNTWGIWKAPIMI